MEYFCLGAKTQHQQELVEQMGEVLKELLRWQITKTVSNEEPAPVDCHFRALDPLASVGDSREEINASCELFLALLLMAKVPINVVGHGGIHILNADDKMRIDWVRKQLVAIRDVIDRACAQTEEAEVPEGETCRKVMLATGQDIPQSAE